MHKIQIKDFHIGLGEPLAIISGPCVIESEEHTLKSAQTLQTMFSKTKINFIFKSSYDKANRSSVGSFRGPGLDEGLRILEKVKKEFGIPILTDVHTPQEALAAAQVCEIIQIPAFLCRQTDLVVAVAKTGAIVNVKKGQFMAPWDMKNVVEKIYSAGNKEVFLTERGATFGYNNLVSDMRAIPIMQTLGVPVCYDATHSVQLPGGQGHQSGGQREFIPVLAKCALAAGANCLYMESHDTPDQAKSDAFSVLSLQNLETLIIQLERLYNALQE